MITMFVVDPGLHNGVAQMAIGDDVTGHQGVAVLNTATWDFERLCEYLRAPGVDDYYVCESFRLYPGKAAAQAWSPMQTCEVIGVIKYLCYTVGHDLTMQQARIKSVGRALATKAGVPMAPRRISGKTVMDFAEPKGPQHPRDALAHGYYWAFKDNRSPAFGKVS